MKAKLAKAPSSGNWIYEIKFDGWRALALKGGSQIHLLSRNSKDLGAKFPEIMVSIAELNAHDAILDGEIVALDEKGRSSFQLLQAHDMGMSGRQYFSTPSICSSSPGRAKSHFSGVAREATGRDPLFGDFGKQRKRTSLKRLANWAWKD
jgi:bifunctional non-homologous end joining protein LigD